MAAMTVLPVLRTTAIGRTNHAGMTRLTEIVVSEEISFAPGVAVSRHSTAAPWWVGVARGHKAAATPCVVLRRMLRWVIGSKPSPELWRVSSRDEGDDMAGTK